MRIAVFIIAILLLAGWADPTQGTLIVLTVLAGLAAARWRPWRPLRARATPDARLATFVLAVLLLAGVIDPTRGWLIGLTVAAGLAVTEFRAWRPFEPVWFGPPHRLRVRGFARRRYWDDWDGEGWR